ncbi:MAG: hypothetical protein ACO20I_08185 [bacterium]|jgi:hypothetical protein
MTEEQIQLRLECLRIAVENGTVADISNPIELADRYYQWVTKPTDSLMQKERKRTTRS